MSVFKKILSYILVNIFTILFYIAVFCVFFYILEPLLNDISIIAIVTLFVLIVLMVFSSLIKEIIIDEYLEKEDLMYYEFVSSGNVDERLSEKKFKFALKMCTFFNGMIKVLKFCVGVVLIFLLVEFIVLVLTPNVIDLYNKPISIEDRVVSIEGHVDFSYIIDSFSNASLALWEYAKKYFLLSILSFFSYIMIPVWIYRLLRMMIPINNKHLKRLDDILR